MNSTCLVVFLVVLQTDCQEIFMIACQNQACPILIHHQKNNPLPLRLLVLADRRNYRQRPAMHGSYILQNQIF